VISGIFSKAATLLVGGGALSTAGPPNSAA